MAKLASEQPVGPFSEEGPVRGGKKRHWLGTRHSISQVGDHRLALVILCVVMKPDKRSPACSQPAVVLKMQTTASGHGIRNRQRKEAGLRPTARPHCSSGNLLGKAGLLPLFLRTQKKTNKQQQTNKQNPNVPGAGGFNPEAFGEQIWNMRRMDSHFTLKSPAFPHAK